MEQELFISINQRWTHPALDLFMAVLSDSAIWLPFLLLAGLGMLLLGGFRARAFLLCAVAALGFSELTVNFLKEAVGRPRPKQSQVVRMVQLQKVRPKILTLFHAPEIRASGPRDRRGRPVSFPSGHTTNNAAIATLLVLFYPRRGWIGFIVAALVAWSRVYLGAHWPGDVAASLLLGPLVAFTVALLFALLWRRLGPSLLPAVATRHPRLCPPLP